jgi:mannose-6-phosphate isomerase-like protein (cupin superfamily)
VASADSPIVNSNQLPWSSPPGHFGAYSKFLVNPAQGSQYFDFRVSLYPPSGFAEPHVHQVAEHIYFIIQGHALVGLDDDTFSVGPGEAIFIAAGVRHSVTSNGLDNLYFVVVTSPPGELPILDTTSQSSTEG